MKIGFIGAGNMGEAYISALFNENEIYFIEPNQARAVEIASKYKAVAVKTHEELCNSVDFIVLAIKPQIINETLEGIKSYCSGKVIISIVAGVSIEKMTAIVGDKKIVRVMPNTPAQIKKGVSGVSFNKNVSVEEKKPVLDILNATGKVIEVEEKYLDVVTGVSGSGPAYVYLLINSLAEGGLKMGLTKKASLELAVETFIGAAEMIKATGLHPEVLKDMVTSPGGTTAAGLFELENAGVRPAMMKAVEAAVLRAKELGK